MNKLQRKLYTLLKEVDDICRQHSITYYLAGGTALGAIRNGGFLPWDDDIDLYITRNNWEKLVEVMKNNTPENRNFVCLENTDKYYDNPVGRYVDRTSTVMLKSQLLCGKACGQLIEFFIMDPLPLLEEEKWEHRRHLKVYAELLSPYFVVGKNILEENKDYDPKLYKKYYLKSKILGKKRVLNELLDKLTKTTEENSNQYCMRWGIRTLIYDKDLLAEPRLELFEKRLFPVPNKQEKVARIAYGDSWMYVPDGSGKITHNTSKNLNVPFEKYTNLYMPLMDREKLIKVYEKNKRIRANALLKKNLFMKEIAKTRALKAKQNIDKSNVDINHLYDLLKNRKFDELNTYFKYFYKAQSDDLVKKDRILIPVSDDYLYLALMTKVLTGKYYTITYILEMISDSNKEINSKLNQVFEMVEFCKKISIAIYDENSSKKVSKLLENNKQYETVLVDYARAKLWRMKRRASNKRQIKNLLSETRKQIDIFGEDGELLGYEAYALYRLGKYEQAKSKAYMAINKSRNGFLWKEINDLFGINAYTLVDS